MNPERNNFRISINLGCFYDDHRSVCRIFVRTDKMKTIGALSKHITKLFNIENFYLKSNNQYLPDLEDIRILDEADLVYLIPIKGKNHYVKDEDTEKVESESEVEVEVKEKKKKRKKKKLEDEPKTKKKKTDFDPVANSTIFSKAAPIINVSETPIKTLAMEVVDENPQEETPNTFKNKKQKNLITILSNDLIKKSADGESLPKQTENNFYTEVDVHKIPKNKLSIAPTNISKEKDSMHQSNFNTPSNSKVRKASIGEQKTLNSTKMESKQDTIGYQSSCNITSDRCKQRTFSIGRTNYEPPTSTIEVQSSTNQSKRNSSFQKQPIGTTSDIEMGVVENEGFTNQTNGSIDEQNHVKNNIEPVEKVLNNSVTRNLSSTGSVKKVELGKSPRIIFHKPMKLPLCGVPPISNESSESDFIQEPIKTPSASTSAVCRKSSGFEERKRSIQPVTVLERRTNIVKTIIASNGDKSLNVNPEKEFEGDKKTEREKSLVEEKDLEVEKNVVEKKEISMRKENESEMEVEECFEENKIETGNCETECNITGKTRNVANSFEVTSTNTKDIEGNTTNKLMEFESNNSGIVRCSSIINSSLLQNDSEIFASPPKPSQNSTQIEEPNVISTTSNVQTNDVSLCCDDETLQIINFDSNSTAKIRPSTIFNTPKSLNTPTDQDPPKISLLKKNNGIGMMMESLKTDSSSAETSRDCVTKRRRVRTRKRKIPTKELGNSPMVLMKTPFFPPNVQSKPAMHIRFDEEKTEETEEIETIEISDSVVMVEESQVESEKDVDIHEVETLRESKSFGLLPEEEISRLPVMQNQTPQKNSVISFKMLKMGEDYTPVVSNFITADVKSFNEDTKEVSLCILEGANEFEGPYGKFSLEEDEETSNAQMLKVLNWGNIIEPRLMFE